MTTPLIEIDSWNRYAPRLVRPPTFTWNAIPGSATYRVSVADPDRMIGSLTVDTNRCTLGALWDRAALGRVDLMITAHAADGGECAAPAVHSVHKVPGWDGARPARDDWAAVIRRNLAYLLAPARDVVRDYEHGWPRSAWSSYEDDVSGVRFQLAYPAQHHPSFIMCYLAFAARFPDDPLAPEAARQARRYGDWLLEHRQPDDFACAGLPFSTVEEGRLGGGFEGDLITLIRVGRVGEAMLALHRATEETPWLDYARHLADVLVRLQRDDGSWPYRVDPRTGEVHDAYTSNAVTPARFLAMFHELEPRPAYDAARSRATRWLLEHPVRDRLWQGQYEDVESLPPYRNLQNWDTLETVRFLLYFRHEDPTYIDHARALIDWVEDVFVIWQRETSPVYARCHTPQVIEQFRCLHPMEVHTANWCLALRALHAVTGHRDDLDKAVAGANAIVRGLQPTGALCTYGSDDRFGRQFYWHVWPGCNACASLGLIQLDAYCQALETGQPAPTPGLEGL